METTFYKFCYLYAQLQLEHFSMAMASEEIMGPIHVILLTKKGYIIQTRVGGGGGGGEETRSGT